MLSFQEQRELISKLYDYSIDENILNEYITRGNTEEQIYNKRYILSAFKNKLSLIDFSDEYIKLVKLYIKLFIVDNEVYYYDVNEVYYNNRKNKIYKLPIPEISATAIYDALTNEPIIEYHPLWIFNNGFIFYPPYDISVPYNTLFTIGYNNPEKLKDVDKIVINDQHILTDRNKHLPCLKILSQALKNDDINLFIDVCTQFPECINNTYTYKIEHGVKLFELTVLFNAIKCFKYMIMNNYYNYDNNRLAYFVAVSNNFEIIRLLENVGIDIFNESSALSGLIDYHRNDIIKYILLKNPTNKPQNVGYYFNRSINSYNYDLMLYILDNYTYIRNNCSYYRDFNDKYKHMPAILYAMNEYNLPYSANWLNMISVLLKLPFSADMVISILKKAPSYISGPLYGSPNVKTLKTCLIDCFRYNKPYEYIDQIVNFIYGSPKIEYNELDEHKFICNRWVYFTPLVVLNTLYKKQVDVNIITFIKVMFYKGYDYNDYDTRMISLLMARRANKCHLKELAILKEFYAKQLENYKRENTQH